MWRAKLVEHVQKTPSVRNLTNPTGMSAAALKTWAAHMSVASTWGDELILYAYSDLAHVRLLIYGYKDSSAGSECIVASDAYTHPASVSSAVTRRLWSFS